MSKPVAVIRNLEDYPDWLDRELVEAYLSTVYRSIVPRFDIAIGPLDAALSHWLNERHIKTFAFITAWNPRSHAAPLETNRQQNAALESMLTAVATEVLPGIGIGTRGDWPPEESFWVLGISPEQAVRAGQHFSQNALVWWEDGGEAELWWLQ